MKQHSVLAICHIAFLAGVAMYVGAFYPACRTLAVLLVLAGAAVEFCPRVFRNPLVPELLLGAVIATAWWLWPPSATTGAVYRAAGMLIAYVLLVPSSTTLDTMIIRVGDPGSNLAAGRIKWLLILVMVELVFGTRLPGSELAAMIVIAIGLLALAIDSWLSGSIPTWPGNPARSNVRASFLRWAILPVLLVIAAANLMGLWVVEATVSYHVAHQPVQTIEAGDEPELVNMPDNFSLGDHRSVERDPRIVARLFWETGSAPTGTVYLRALALPDLVLSGPAIAWLAQSHSERRALLATSGPNRWAQVDRVASPSEVVLRPDGNGTVELPNIASDDAENLYCAELRNRSDSYRVGFDEQSLKADPALVQRCLEVDPRLNDLPWDQIEDPSWGLMAPERAAELICAHLQSICGYEIKGLPLPMAGFGGALRGFLFGPTPEARRGHCQYFATAAVLLLRRAGHPARCVGGFASNEIDPRGITFRVLHLHAWIEIINSRGEWQRFDPSPESRMDKILAGVTLPVPKARHLQSPGGKNPAAFSPSVQGWPRKAVLTFWAILLGGLAVLGAFRHRKAFSNPSKASDPRVAELQRRNDDLIKVATSLAIVVTPATTLSDLVAALERRTSISLDDHLQAHLAARFGQGPLPAPWPLAALAKAGKADSFH
jgi:Transglutaminase-like superfamily